MALQEREIEVRGKKYRFVLTPAGKALLALRKITAKMSALIPNLVAKNPEKVNEDLFEIVTEQYDELFETFVDVNQLKYKDKKSDWKLVENFDEHFQGECLAPVELLYKVILENDKDFFHSLPSLIVKKRNQLNEFLLANLSQTPNGTNNPMMDNIANSLKEKLG